MGVLGVAGLHVALFSSGFDRIPGDAGDARSFVYLAEHWYQVFRGQADLLSPGMFYPVQGTLGYTDPIPAHALSFSVLRLSGFDMFSALVGAVVLFNLLNYVTCFLLLNRVLRLTAIASGVGAMFFAFNSPRFSHAGHFNLQAEFFLPLTIALVVHFVRAAATLTQQKAFWLLSAAVLCVNLQLVTSLYHGWFFSLWAFLVLVLGVVVRPTRVVLSGIIRRFWPALAGSALVFALGLVPVLVLYVPVARSVGPRPWRMVNSLIPEGWSLLQMGQGNYVWGGVSAALSRLHPLPSTEHNIGIGLVPSVAWLAVTVWAVRAVTRYAKSRSSGDGPVESWYAWLAVAILATTCFYIIGMKYWDDASPWRLVYLFVPGATGLRGVARYVMLLSLPMAIVFGVGVEWGLEKISAQTNAVVRQRLRVAMLAVVAFGVFEQFGRAPAFSKSAQLARLNRLAATLPGDCASFYVVAAADRRPIKYEYQIDAMLVSAMRRVPTLNGYSGHVPPGWSLREVEAPDYGQRIEEWIARHQVKAPVCRLVVGD